MVAIVVLRTEERPGLSFKLVDGDDGIHDDLIGIIEEIQTESDRGVGIVAGAVLEDLLQDMLSSSFQTPEFEQVCFSGTGPLGTFSSKISLARSLGLLSGEEAADLNIVRRIRNEFAHVKSVSFEAQGIADRCNAMKFGQLKTRSLPARIVFLGNVLPLMLELFSRPANIKRSRPTVVVRRSVEFLGLGDDGESK